MQIKQHFWVMSFLLLGSFVAQGSIIIDTDNSASGSLGIVQLGNGAVGTTVTGIAPGGAVLNFTGNETLVAPSGGQARVEAQDGAFTQLNIQFLLPLLFDRMVFNLDSNANGSVRITAVDQSGTPFTTDIAVGQSGQNFINVDSDDAQQVRSISILGLGAVSFSDIAQIRVGGITEGNGTPPNVIPEPATFTLMGLGLVGAVVGRRYLQRSR